jgi:hypothetical protein
MNITVLLSFPPNVPETRICNQQSRSSDNPSHNNANDIDFVAWVEVAIDDDWWHGEMRTTRQPK